MYGHAFLGCPKAPANALPDDLNYISEELKTRARTELFEDDDTRVHSLQLLRSMLKEEKNLRCQDDDLFLLAFLRCRKFDVKKAFSLIKGFYGTFARHHNLYYNLDFDRMKCHMDQNTVYFLPFRDGESSVIMTFRFTGWDPAAFNAEETLVCVSLGFLQALLSPSTQIAGFQLIGDFKDLSIKHLLNVKPSILKFFVDIIQDTVPARIKGFHVVNENSFFSYIWVVIKKFLSSKLRDRVHLHGKDMKSLHKFFHPSILPAELEGELPPFNNSDWRQKMVASSDYIKHVLSFGYEKHLIKD